MTTSDSIDHPPAHRAIAIWLLIVAGLVFAMVLVGGATRLTDSGLSITEWKPVTGAIPPLSAEAWQSEFEKYQQIPEYELVNQGMSLAEFKSIYYWEWGHRLLGRVIGMAFLLPFLWFLFRGAVERRRLPRLIILFVLGGSQGALGWYMVMSGLADRVDVSQYRLAAHLGLAVLIYGALLWTAMDYLRGTWGAGIATKPHRGFAIGVVILSALIFDQMLAGAFVAGLNAGFTYNTWPLMDGQMIPDGMFMMEPWVRNLFENDLTVQFIHRMEAYLVLAAGVGLWFYGRRLDLSPRAAKACNMLLSIIGLQVVLGIATLLAAVPLSLGLLHQAGAVMTFTASLYLAHLLWAKPA